MFAASTCHIESTFGTVAFQVTVCWVARYDNKIYRWACQHLPQIVLYQQIKSFSSSHDVDTTVLFDKALTFCSCYVRARCRSCDYLLVWAHCKETCSTDAGVSLFSPVLSSFANNAQSSLAAARAIPAILDQSWEAVLYYFIFVCWCSCECAPLSPL